MNPAEFKATAAALSAAVDTACLTDREKHLIGLAVTVTRGCSYCTGGRIKKALESGVPRDSLIAAIDMAAAVGAGVTIRTALLGADQAAVGACTDPSCGGPTSRIAPGSGSAADAKR